MLSACETGLGLSRRRRGGLRPPACLPPRRRPQRRRQPVEGGRRGDGGPDGDLLRPALAAEQAADRGAARRPVDALSPSRAASASWPGARARPTSTSWCRGLPGPRAGHGQPAGTQHAPIEEWAAFVLSGWGNEKSHDESTGTPQTTWDTGTHRDPHARRASRGQSQEPASGQPKPEPLKAVLHLRIDDPVDETRRNLRLDQPKVLPLKAGDRFRIEAKLNRPAYIYVFWVGSDGKVSPIYPWKPGHWDRRPDKRTNSIASTCRQRPTRPGKSRLGAPESRRCSCSAARKPLAEARRREARKAFVRRKGFQLRPDQRRRLARERPRDDSRSARPLVAQRQDPQERRPRAANPPALQRQGSAARRLLAGPRLSERRRKVAGSYSSGR